VVVWLFGVWRGAWYGFVSCGMGIVSWLWDTKGADWREVEFCHKDYRCKVHCRSTKFLRNSSISRTTGLRTSLAH
jgi:hypothetical protein